MMNLSQGHNLPLTKYLLESRALQTQPMRIFDIGARGGFEPHWNNYGNQIELIGFEPDPDECEQMNQAAKNAALRREYYYPTALYRDKSIQTLYVTKNLVASSLLKTNQEWVNRFPHSDPGTVVATTQIQTTDIDSFIEENGLEYVDFMKIDVEGAELEVFAGANKTLSDSLLGISVEVFFHPYHIGRPLFTDIDQNLRKFGFVLFDFLNLEKWCRKTLATSDPISWYGNGQLIWAQALYLRDLVAEMKSSQSKITQKDKIKLLKLASLAELFNVSDYAIELLETGNNMGILDEKETEEMVHITKNKKELNEECQQKSTIHLFKQTAKTFVPSLLRRKLRTLLETLMSS